MVMSLNVNLAPRCQCPDPIVTSAPSRDERLEAKIEVNTDGRVRMNVATTASRIALTPEIIARRTNRRRRDIGDEAGTGVGVMKAYPLA